ncbi:MAG: hypothetical protein IPN76_30985 [Saprospiraceae bacterium]|nr:hypothetical protein [Saprospiraceae bacterium]
MAACQLPDAAIVYSWRAEHKLQLAATPTAAMPTSTMQVAMILKSTATMLWKSAFPKQMGLVVAVLLSMVCSSGLYITFILFFYANVSPV